MAQTLRSNDVEMHAASQSDWPGEVDLLDLKSVAARRVFWHLGHFSADYKHQFSELPSETLRAARPGAVLR